MARWQTMVGQWFARGGSPEAGDTSAHEPATLQRADVAAGGALALYVTGPRDRACHLLPARGLITLGRSDRCSIVLADARVSRSHAAIQLGEAMALSDLGSANGTRIGTKRLARREAMPLTVGETFFVGDSALVVRDTGLERVSEERLLPLAKLLDRLPSSSELKARGVLVLTARARTPASASWLETIVGNVVQPSQGWLGRIADGQLVVVLPSDRTADAAALEASAVEELSRWGIGADIDCVFVDAGANGVGDAVVQVLRGGRQLRLERGAIVLRDAVMQELHRTVLRVARASVTVLVLGETGSGKDVIASMVHELSPRAGKPFMRLNCANLPEQLLESELFGHERGAFTGAVQAKAGLLEAADGGTVFLDEVGELSLALQAKLLRAIESREVTRLGASRSRAIDVRFVAATNRDLAGAVERGEVRRDLFYRLNGITLTVPPLRERPSELEPLARQFAADACARFAVETVTLSPGAVRALKAHSWPGNVRELRNVIERAVLLADERVLEARHLGLDAAPGQPAANEERPAPPQRHPPVEPRRPPRVAARGRGIDDENTAVKAGDDGSPDVDGHAVRVESIRRTLRATAGHRGRAAQLLGISRSTLYRYIDAYAIDVTEFDRPRPGGDDV